MQLITNKLSSLNCGIAILFLASLPFEAVAQIDSPGTAATAQDAKVDNSQLPTGRGIKPAGDLISFHGRPVDLKLSPQGKWLFVKDRGALRVIDVAQWKLTQSVDSPGGASLWGLAVSKDNRVYFSNSKSGLHVFAPIASATDGSLTWQLERTIKLPGDSFPCGVKLSPDESLAFVCLSKKNQVACIDLKSDEIVQTIDVGVAPFDLHLDGDQLFVSNIGGRRPRENDKTAPSAGTETVVDDRGIVSTGTISLIDLKTNQVTQQFDVGLHPSVMASGRVPGSTVVCNTNEDSISFLAPPANQVTAVPVKPDDALPFGSMPSAIHYFAKQGAYAVALAGNNAVALVKPGVPSQQAKIKGLIPTAWYPVALDSDENFLYVGCVKGVGARADLRPAEKGRNSHDHLGTVQRISLKQIFDPDQLANWTGEVRGLSRVNRIIDVVGSPETNPSNNKPVPIPARLGEPSVFKHVIYVIKENRTFDQVFGDIAEARSDPNLCVFPEKTTPNHHALARRFGVLDNYYCNGVLSADGHAWAVQGNVTPYLERAFGGFARTYDLGRDAITYSSSGFLWDHFLAAGLSFRNYGELDYATAPAGMKYQEIWQAYAAGKPIEFQQEIGVERLRHYSCRDYPGWNMTIPDVLRMDRFLKEFRDFEEKGGLPNLIIIYLPQDHLGGGVTSEAHMADNDLALGRLVDAVSHSRFWKDTVLFVNEDDPQNGYDHIDGHRSLCLVISPYSRPGINHSFANQTSVLRTMLHIFGLPPMNQQDASVPLMTHCFQDVADLRPYDVIEANYPLNQAPPPKLKQSALERKWREILATVPIKRTGMKTEIDEANLNRFVWHEVRGWNAPYPGEWAGPHATGLKQLGLKIDPTADDD